MDLTPRTTTSPLTLRAGTPLSPTLQKMEALVQYHYAQPLLQKLYTQEKLIEDTRQEALQARHEKRYWPEAELNREVEALTKALTETRRECLYYLTFAAKRNLPEAQFDLGQYAATIEKEETAILWLTCASDQGHKEASLELYKLYLAQVTKAKHTAYPYSSQMEVLQKQVEKYRTLSEQQKSQEQDNASKTTPDSTYCPSRSPSPASADDANALYDTLDNDDVLTIFSMNPK